MGAGQLKLGAVLSYATILLSNAVGIILTPFILRALGQAEYGLYSLIGSLVGYLIILDFGMGNTIVRYVAKYRAEHDEEGGARFLWLSFKINLLLALILSVVGMIMYLNMDGMFAHSLQADELRTAKKMFLVLLLNMFLSFVFSTFGHILTGHEVFVFPRVMGLVRIVARAAAIFLLLSAGFGSLAIVWIDTILNILLLSANAVYCLVVLKVRFHRGALPQGIQTEFLQYSFFIFLQTIVDQIYWRLGQIMLGILGSTVMVAVFAIGMQMTNYYLQFSTAISGVFLPRATHMIVNKADRSELTNLMVRAGRLQFLVLGFILSGFALFGKEFLILWAGPEYEQSWGIAMVLMLPLTIVLCQTVGLSILQAANLHRFRSILYLAIAMLNAMLTYPFIVWFGLFGAALGTTLSLVIGNVLIMNIYYHKKVELDMPLFFRQVFGRMAGWTLLSVVCAIPLRHVPVGGWGGFLLRAIAFSILYLVIMWFKALNDEEKKMLAGPVAKLLRR